MAQNTPQAVAGDGSPEPPSSWLVPVTYRVVDAQEVHVGLRRADVLGREVAAAEAVDEPAVGVEQRVGPERGRVADDHGLAAALVVAARGVLVGHAPGEPADVDGGALEVGVGAEPGAAERGTEHRGVDRDHGPEAAGGVGSQVQRLAAVGGGDVVEVTHGGHANAARDGNRVDRSDQLPAKLYIERGAATSADEVDGDVGLEPQEQLLTPSEVAAMFRVNPKTVTRWARAGKLTAIRTLGRPPALQALRDPALPRGDGAG